MKLRICLFFSLFLPLLASLYWFIAIRPRIEIGYARIAAPMIDVRADAAGMLASFQKTQGDWVEEGDLLFSLAAAEDEAALADLQAQAALLGQALSGYLADAEIAMQEYLNARSEEAIGLQPPTDHSLSHLEQNQALIQRCKQEAGVLDQKIELAKHSIQRKRIASPARGFLIEKHKQENESVSSGEIICTLCNPKTLWVEALVPESAVSKIHIGQTALASLNSSLTCKGVVSWISPIALPGHAGIPIRVALEDNYPECLRPNLQVRLTLNVR